ncbi:dipeptidase E [Dysgonomonas sp. PFB1-18]|uniref:Type 1 glutamine amidotransferase-like domain-containing protein n=1 Tax=unclassified Dysgonomonas TaxID=2630389 RepID=UPI0024735A3D|nr:MULTISPECIES: Type 1 glutamine amidotransferase-like domain-containing protein [unclassified Dysgonomonas]MDH6310424.1 dipeptidase E [Dysgonomonas sp. PF1-14]MDH6340246.1 dipeptidase E [Dysgonomonas sp. PF1-16]MDH6381973.1 dipeptidase E [Dysgonomonas sp. PFB1-18]MDH6399218.1 dipeptidase E [Dysgonomonas sp. PF1-23]
MKRLFLSSSFADVADLFKEFAKEDIKGKAVTFIPTASNVEEVKFYVDLAREAFREMGLIVDELDVSKMSGDKMTAKLKENDYIYISGGNTFYLLQELKRSGADKMIADEINSGKLYIGESAGSMIVSPDIEYAKEMDDFKKAPDLDTFSALNIIDFYPLPHYKSFPFEEAVEKIIAKYGAKLNLYPISNSQVILVERSNVRVK